MLPMYYNKNMNKVSKEKLINILKNDSNLSYKKLSTITGYHPKSLIRINRLINEGKYKILKRQYKPYNKLSDNMINTIINLYKISSYKTLRKFYNSEIKGKYKISYSKTCEIIRVKSLKNNEEILFIIKKAKQIIAIDNMSESIIYKQEVLKFNEKTITKFIKEILKTYEIPKKICFVYLLKITKYLKELSYKFNFEIIPYSYKYKKIINTKNYNTSLAYKNKTDKYMFYDSIVRKIISVNIIQFQNKRYKILTDKKINHLEEVTLYYNNNYSDMFISYKNIKYNLELVAFQKSFKGNSKY